jgi:ribosomal protein S12 methylthiotransferase
MEDIISEANEMVKNGVSEIILIAQDTTGYGLDIYKKPMLAELIKNLNKIENLNWLRIMYAYPTQMTDELLKTIAECDKVVKYIDIPLQHSHPEMLKLMNRPAFDYRPMIEKIRKIIPNVCIRTAFIVGYPGETEEHFDHLCEFVKDMKFDRMGVFCYSREKGTPSYSMKPRVPAKVAKARYKKLMEIQQKISADRNKSLVGKIMPCMIEYYTDDGQVVARTQFDAPEIDGMVYIETDKPVVPGDIEQVKITGCTEYDLVGEIL